MGGEPQRGWKNSFAHADIADTPIDSTEYIRMTEYKNPGNILYESNAAVPRMAVFSEVYYKTWKAYIDGKEVEPVRVNYILRALPIPAGEHKIEFRCVDELMIFSAKLSLYGSIFVGIVIVLLCVTIIRKKKTDE